MSTYALSGGVDAQNGFGGAVRYSFVGQWAQGETWTLLVTSTAGDFTLGKGSIAGATPVIGTVLGERVYLAIGDEFFGSANGDATLWEEQNPGAMSISIGSNFGVADQINALSNYQGRIAVYGRQSIQIWVVDADPSLFQRQQVLANTGTFAPLSVHSLGDLDSMYLHDTGIRSLRVRDQSLNAYVNDIGSPIDQIIQDKLSTCTDNQKAAACGIVDPSAMRYWLFIKDTIYVLSYFPSLKVVAWATYNPEIVTGMTFTVTISNVLETDNITITYGPSGIYTATAAYTGDMAGTMSALGVIINAATGTTGYVASAASGTGIVLSKATGIDNNPSLTFGAAITTGTYSIAYTKTAFVPLSFVVHEGQVYVDATDAIYQYGGTDNKTYDHCTSTVSTAWLAANKPGTYKHAKGVDVIWDQIWTLSLGMNFDAGTRSEVYSSADPSFGAGGIPSNGYGTHFSMSATSAAAARSVLSSLIFHYKEGNETI